MELRLGKKDLKDEYQDFPYTPRFDWFKYEIQRLIREAGIGVFYPDHTENNRSYITEPHERSLSAEEIMAATLPRGPRR